MNVYGDLSAVGQEYVGIFPLLDWHHINGVTAEHATPIVLCPDKGSSTVPQDPQEFVGGVSDGVSTAVVMDTRTHNLRAHRAWLLLDDSVVAMGSALVDTVAKADVHTTLASRLLPPHTSPGGVVTVGFTNGTVTSINDGEYAWPAGNVSWFHAAGIGYGLVGTTVTPPITLSIATKTGNWSLIGPFPGSSSGRLLTAWIPHGPLTAAPGGEYLYQVYANVSATEMPTLVSGSAGVSCLTNTPTLQGAVDAHAQLAAVIIWPGDAAASYTCATGWAGLGPLRLASNTPGLVLVRQVADQLHVAFASPTAIGASVKITVSGVTATGTGCLSSGGDTIVTIPLPTSADLTGASVVATCTISA